jgi:hypothetical protein
VHDRIGKCAVGACSYAVHYVSCPAGCAAGVCKPSGWTSMTSNSNQSLWSVWGTSASSVWAVGYGGTALYYNGIQWQARPTATQVQGDVLTSLSGTSDGNIFAVGTAGLSSIDAGTSVIHFDGTSWSFFGRIPIAAANRASCVAAYGDNDAFVWGLAYPNSDMGALYRVINGVANLIMTVPATAFSNQSQCGIHVFSPSDIVVTANTQIIRIDSVAHTSAVIGSGSIPGTTGALWADLTNDLFVTLAANAYRWTGGPTWTSLTTGLNGALAALSGTSTNRVFAAGGASSPGMTVGTVLFWDGLGWTVQALPSATPRLQGIWASPLPEGRVFAVGINGTIVTGP